ALRAGERVRRVLDEHFYATLAREHAKLFERGKRRIHFALVEFFALNTDVLDQIAERNLLGDFDGALNFFHHAETFVFHRLRDGDDRIRPGTPPHIIRVHRRVQRVKLQFGIAEPVAKLSDLALVTIIQVLASAENLNQGNARVPNTIQPHGGE